MRAPSQAKWPVLALAWAAVIDRQAAAIDALTRLLEAPADLPAEDVRPGAGAGGKKEGADGGPMGRNEVPGP